MHPSHFLAAVIAADLRTLHVIAVGFLHAAVAIAFVAHTRIAALMPLRVLWVFAIANQAHAVLPAPAFGVVFAPTRFDIATITKC